MTNEQTIWWPTVADVVAIHRSMMCRGGDAPAGCNEAKLDEALNRPRWLFHYVGNSEIIELGVALASAIAISHAFADGNKRTSLSVLSVSCEEMARMLSVKQAKSRLVSRSKRSLLGFRNRWTRAQKRKAGSST